MSEPVALVSSVLVAADNDEGMAALEDSALLEGETPEKIIN